jgi:hypothetical protein
MKTFTLAALALGLFAGSAFAQNRTPMQLLDDAKKHEQADVDRQYSNTMKANKTAPAPQASQDPWANVRPANPPPKAKRQAGQ